MKKFFLGLHVISLTAALVSIGLLYWPAFRVVFLQYTLGWMLWLIPLLTVIAFIAGIIEMTRRSGKSESILLAVSTVIAFVLMFVTFFGVAVSGWRVSNPTVPQVRASDLNA